MSDTPQRIKIEPAGDWSDVWDASSDKSGTGDEIEYVRADIHEAAVSERDNVIMLLKRALVRLPEEDILRVNGTDYLRRIGAFNPLRKEGT